MFKVLIVDDEKHIRERLTHFFPWSDVGFEVIGSAEHGRDALEMMKYHQAHAVLTDVLMPEMTGLELAKEIGVSYPETKVIILSAYDDFKYAQDAIKYGVQGYLLKPLTKKDFLDVFSKISEELKKESELSKQNVQKDQLISEELFVLELIKGLNVEKYVDDQRLITESSRVVICSFDRMFKENSTYSMRKTISEQTTDFWKRYNVPVLFYGNSIILIITGSKSASKEDLHPKLQEFAVYLNRLLTEAGNIEDAFVIGVGNIAKSTDEINRSYNEAVYAYSLKYFYDNASIIFYKDSPYPNTNEVNSKGNDKTFDPFNHLEATLLECVLTEELKDLPFRIDEYFDELKHAKGLQITEIRGACAELILFLMFRLKDKGLESHSVEIQRVLENIYVIDSLNELKRWLKNILETISYELGDKRSHDVNHYVLRAKEYINTHYQEKLTLLDMSNMLFLHQAYFSAIFKKETSQNFIDYVNEVRVEKAADLLRKTDYKINVISHMVGFQSNSYFNRVFKNTKNLSPLRYRRQWSR